MLAPFCVPRLTKPMDGAARAKFARPRALLPLTRVRISPFTAWSGRDLFFVASIRRAASHASVIVGQALKHARGVICCRQRAPNDGTSGNINRSSPRHASARGIRVHGARIGWQRRANGAFPRAGLAIKADGAATILRALMPVSGSASRCGLPGHRAARRR